MTLSTARVWCKAKTINKRPYKNPNCELWNHEHNIQWKLGNKSPSPQIIFRAACIVYELFWYIFLVQIIFTIQSFIRLNPIASSKRITKVETSFCLVFWWCIRKGRTHFLAVKRDLRPIFATFDSLLWFIIQWNVFFIKLGQWTDCLKWFF